MAMATARSAVRLGFRVWVSGCSLRAMIRVYLVRHGIAVNPADSGGLPDDDRPLTGKGRRRFRRAARAFARLGELPDFLFTSPLIRAAQTAEILAGGSRADEVAVLEELRSGAA